MSTATPNSAGQAPPHRSQRKRGGTVVIRRRSDEWSDPSGRERGENQQEHRTRKLGRSQWFLSSALLGVAVLVCVAAAVDVPEDNWELWGTQYPTGDPARDKLLVEGRLRNAMKVGNFSDFVRAVSSSLGPDVNAADSDGRTGLHYAAMEGHGGDWGRPRIPWVSSTTTSHPWHPNFQFFPGTEMYDTTFLQRVKMYLENNGHPPLDVKARDRSGQTPLHEAALRGHLMTVRWLGLNQAFTPDTVAVDDDGTLLDDEYVRAKKLHREWAFGWTMMNWAAVNARNDVRRRRILGDLQRASENPQNYGATNGLTVLDYAVIGGFADIVEWIVKSGTIGTGNIARARSNWNEQPIHKATSLGHTDVFRFLLSVLGCTAVVAESEARETPLHNAAGGGHYEILQYAQDSCPNEVNNNRRTRATRFNEDVNNVRYAWGGETPCQISSALTSYINDNVKTCPDGKCSGHFRSHCTHDESVFCFRHSDCQALDPQSACDLETDRELEALDMLSHWQSCNLLCGVSAPTLCVGNPSE